MENPQSCPQCLNSPTFITKDSYVEIRCDQHGYIAMGDNLEMAINHWNRFIDFIRKAA